MKELIMEINRNRELMGFKKLLNENNIFETFSEILSDFILTSEKKLPGITDEVEVGGMRVATKVLKDIKDVLKTPSLFNYLDDTSKIIMAKIASQSEEYVDDVYKSLFTGISKQLRLSETDIISRALEQRKAGKSLSQIISDMTGDADPFIPNVLTKKLYKKIRDFEQNSLIEEIPKPPSSVSDDLASKLKNVTVKKVNASPELSTLRKFFASNKTVTNAVRKNINRTWIYFEEQTLGEQKFIQSIYNDLIRTSNRLTGNLTQQTSNEVITELRNVSQKIHRVLVKNEKNETSIDTLYNEIEKILSTVDDSEIRNRVPDLMKSLRESDPFREASLLEKSWFWQFLNTTASQKTINAIARLIKNSFTLKKEALNDLLELVDRFLGWLATASFKQAGIVSKGNEFKYGIVSSRGKGALNLIGDLWVAQHIGIPATIALFEVVKNLIQLIFTKHDGTIYANFRDALVSAFGEAFVSEYENNKGEVTFKSFVEGLSLHKPGVFKLWNWFDTTEQGDNRLVLPDDWKQKFKDEGYSPEQIDEILKTAKSPEEAEEMLKRKLTPSPNDGDGNVAPGAETSSGGNVAPGGDDETVPGGE